jgi:glycosyltransferase involved in cell wall biosynthesis
VLAWLPVRILIDYRPALVSRTGVGEYAHELTAALLPHLTGGDALTLFSSSWKDRLTPARMPGAHVVDARIPVRLLDLVWHRLQWPPVEMLAGTVDVAHSTRPLLMPARKAAQVITIHDLFFLDHSTGGPIEVRRDYPALVERHAQRADAVITISRYSATQIGRRLGVSADRIALCPPGAPAWAPRHPPPPDGPILFVGSAEPRKNVEGLLRGYVRLRERARDAPTLVLAGPPPGDATPIRAMLNKPPLSQHARHVGYVSEAERLRWFREASILVMPSLDEGFGMPVLEAMTIGLPVVAANRGALPEVAGDAALLVDPNDVDGMAGAMDRMLNDCAFADCCVSRGFRRAANYTWRASALALLQAYHDAVARRRDRA